MIEGVRKPILSSCDPRSGSGAELSYVASSSIASAVWPTANLARFVPVVVEYPTTIRMMGLSIVAVGGNIDLGIYRQDGTQLVSTGSTPVAATGFMPIDIADTLLAPGLHYLAVAADVSSGLQVQRLSVYQLLQRLAGIREMASAFPLPATATLATPTMSSTTMVPFLVASSNAVI